jgi:hypothetical protein
MVEIWLPRGEYKNRIVIPYQNKKMLDGAVFLGERRNGEYEDFGILLPHKDEVVYRSGTRVERFVKPVTDEEIELFSRKTEDFLRIYRDCFPRDDLREPDEVIYQLIENSYSKGLKNGSSEQFVVGIFDNKGKTVGGRILQIIKNGDVIFGAGEYIFTTENERRKGYGKRVHYGTLCMLERFAKRNYGSGLVLKINDFEDPKNERNGIQRNSVKHLQRDSMKPEERLDFYGKLGYSIVDPKIFKYYQPAIEEGGDPVPMLLGILNTGGLGPKNKISTDMMKAIIEGWCFFGFTGSINGHRDIYRDIAYKDMIGQIETLERKRISAIPLVPLVPHDLHLYT